MNPSRPSWGECYFDHFSRYLRAPIARQVFETDAGSPSIQILAYENVFPQCMTFCTIGLSHFEREVGGVCEIVLPVDDGLDDVPFILTNTLLFMRNSGTSIVRGASAWGIEQVQETFARRFEKSALYFTDPIGLPEPFADVTCGEGARGRVLMGIFISEAEFRFLHQQGTEAFENALAEQEVDFCSLSRRSLF
jgi:hypothetical protein